MIGCLTETTTSVVAKPLVLYKKNLQADKALFSTQTNRISRIFSGGAKGGQKPQWISPKSQIIICTGTVV